MEVSMVNHEETKGKFPWELGKRISQAAKVFTERKLLFKGHVSLFAAVFLLNLKRVFASIEFQN